MVISTNLQAIFSLKRILFLSLIASHALFAVSIPRGGNILLRNQVEDTSSTTSDKKSYSLYLSEDNYGDHSTGIYKTTFGGERS